VLLPGILLWRGSETMFGWARPVPVDTQKFKDPLKDDMLVSFAGPGMNLLIAIVAIVFFMLIALILRLWSPEALSLNLAMPYAMMSIAGPGLPGWLVIPAAFLKDLLYASVVLGFLNLLPIPPLDGARILAGILPDKGRQLLERVQKYSFVIIIALMMTPVLDYVLAIPVIASWSALAMVFAALGLS
jgi:Zn-dependent protease